MVSVGQTHPLLIMLAAALQDVLKLDDAVRYEVVVSNRRVVEDRQLYPAAVDHLRGELVVPRGAVGLLLGGGLPHARVVHVQGYVGVQEEGLILGTHGVTQGPSRGLQVQRLADPDPQLSVEDHHGALEPTCCQTPALH